MGIQPLFFVFLLVVGVSLASTDHASELASMSRFLQKNLKGNIYLSNAFAGDDLSWSMLLSSGTLYNLKDVKVVEIKTSTGKKLDFTIKFNKLIAQFLHNYGRISKNHFDGGWQSTSTDNLVSIKLKLTKSCVVSDATVTFDTLNGLENMEGDKLVYLSDYKKHVKEAVDKAVKDALVPELRNLLIKTSLSNEGIKTC